MFVSVASRLCNDFKELSLAVYNCRHRRQMLREAQRNLTYPHKASSMCFEEFQAARQDLDLADLADTSHTE